MTGPFEDRAALAGWVPELVAAAGDDPERLIALGAMAWLLARSCATCSTTRARAIARECGRGIG